MNVLVAMDSFKGSLTSEEANHAVSKGVKEVNPKANIISIPLADGGEGTIESIINVKGGKLVTEKVTGPLNQKITSTYGIFKNQKTAIIEIAEVCGLPLIPESKLNPLKATTFGVGELINSAIEKGCNEIIVGLGGSATNDGGIGMLQALGFSFFDKNKKEVEFGGDSLKKIFSISDENVNPKLVNCNFKVACDVNNLLLGTDGATHIFGEQKGATSETIKKLESGMHNFVNIVYQTYKINISSTPGAGAAGGLGAAFKGFLKGKLLSGIDLMLDILDVEKHIAIADYVITGEGKLDNQTSLGKVPVGIGRCASKYRIPVIALAGYLSKNINALNNHGITSCFSIINKPMSVEESMQSEIAYENLKFTTTQLFYLIKNK